MDKDEVFLLTLDIRPHFHIQTYISLLSLNSHSFANRIPTAFFRVCQPIVQSPNKMPKTIWQYKMLEKLLSQVFSTLGFRAFFNITVKHYSKLPPENEDVYKLLFCFSVW